MSSRVKQWLRRFGLSKGIALLLAWCMPAVAFAQMAPVMGQHYAARTTDTGFSGAVNSTGDYGASVPLDLPAARGGLPVPVQVVYGGNRIGAAGMSWDVPLSTIVRSKTLAHRRAQPGTFSDADPLSLLPETLSLSLAGQQFNLVRNPDGTRWVAQYGDAQLEVRDNGDGTMVVYDGNGLTYHFSSQGATAGSSLDNGNLYLLRDITGTGGKTHLDYSIQTSTLPGGGTGTGLSINLQRVQYNQYPDPTSDCFKNTIYLNYGATETAPLSMSVLGSTVLVRVQKVDSIDVFAKGATCLEAPVSLRRYDFTYQTDPDTKRPQLQKVIVRGQSGTPERDVTLPVATYTYGTLTDSNGAITYQKTQSINLGADFAPFYDFGIAYTAPDQVLSGGYISHVLRTPQEIVDLNGDGRPDFVTSYGVLRNQPSATQGQTSFTSASESGLSAFVPEVETSNGRDTRYNVWQFPSYNPQGEAVAYPAGITTSTWKQYIDINGDGRLDFIDASVSASYWLVHLNTPDPTDPTRNIFVERRISLAGMRANLGVLAGKLPLASTLTSHTQGMLRCYIKIDGILNYATFSQCPQFEDEMRARAYQAGQKTFARWELKDINGDGYPDFVYDNSPGQISGYASAPNDMPSNVPTISQGPGATYPDTRTVRVMYNTAGVGLGVTDGLVFDGAVILGEEGKSCGLGRWEGIPGDGTKAKLYQTCGLEDVSGDGIADRVASKAESRYGGPVRFYSTATLGTGNPDAPFAEGATLALPGALSLVETDMVQPFGLASVPKSCANNEPTYNTVRTQALRDINGDGLPDYVSEYFGTWSVSFGTGAGFSAPKPMATPAGLALAVERNVCFNPDAPITAGVSRTRTGLYDLDGDGQPEVLDMNPITDKLDVYQLKSPISQFEIGAFASVPQAGRLIAIDNGYGVSTRLSYQSAKVDPGTPHIVPSPEIVVGAELTTDSANPSILKAVTVRRAYGHAGQVFDSVRDRFVFPGYGRTATLVNGGVGATIVTLTDTYGLAPFVPGSDAAARFKRDRKTGLVKDVTTLSVGFSSTDPSSYLTVDIAGDARRIAGAHYDWDARLLTSGPAIGLNEPCVEMMFPYDYTASLAAALDPNDVCVRRGFVFQKEALSWRGKPGTTNAYGSTATVETRSSVEAIDDFGRISRVRNDNDRAIASDDLCTRTSYANPVLATDRPRVLNAVAARNVDNCVSTTVIARHQYTYDGLPQGSVSQGLLRRHSPFRLDENGNTIEWSAGRADYNQFDVFYDIVGNPVQYFRNRPDGASTNIAIVYDAFGLAQRSVTVSAVNPGGKQPPAQTTTIDTDPLTLQVLGRTDANGTQTGALYDGFGRVLQSLVKPPGGNEGALSSITYLGFAVGQTGGRRVQQKVFADPVDPVAVATSAGRIGTTYVDALGRTTRSEVQLGADYANKVMVTGERLYDLFGRVEFEADPYPLAETVAHYGTTSHFNGDGTPKCVIRGFGKQALTEVTVSATLVFPTCVTQQYIADKLIVETRDASSNLPGSPQAGAKRWLTFGATGRRLKDWTLNSANALVESTGFGYDALGHQNKLVRYLTPATSSDPVTTTLYYDSFGQVIRLDEPDSAPQFRTYDKWNQLTQVQWTEVTVGGSTPSDEDPFPSSFAGGDGESTPPAGTDKRSINRYDGLGRPVHSEDQINQLTDPVTVRDFVYDQAFSNAAPAVTATNVIGRLAKATANTSSVFFSYDSLGRPNAQVFSDTTVSPAKVFVQKNEFHGDGSLQALHLLLPDHNFADERVSYSYDSAGRSRAVTYTDGSTVGLYKADGANDIDVFGRLRNAQFGQATFEAIFADTGRRKIQSWQVTTPTGHNRGSVFNGFDPVGRELGRGEFADYVNTSETQYIYGSTGRLHGVARHNPLTFAKLNEAAFTYDPLGNMTDSGFLVDTNRTKIPGQQAEFGEVQLSYIATDRDRVCSIGYGTNTPPTICNVSYDFVGNIISQPTRNGGTRSFSYLPSGRVRQIIQGTSVATYDYDAFGAVQRLALASTTSGDTRQDKYFGRMMSLRNEAGVPVFTRTIPIPLGSATRHGPTGNWTFAFVENRGTRLVTNEQGEFAQTVDYHPYGESKNPAGASPGSTDYAREQWNGGDLLAAFGINQLGARLYDPVIGRFLSRDPLFDAGNGLNPYAFAANDPINNSDPSGLCVEYGCRDTGGGTGCAPGVNCPGDNRGGDTGGGAKDCTWNGTCKDPNPRHIRDPDPAGGKSGCHGGCSDGIRPWSSKPVQFSYARDIGVFFPEGVPNLDLVGQAIDAATDALSDFTADTFNGIMDLQGASHPGHATVYAEVEPGIRSATTYVLRGGELIATLATGAAGSIEAAFARGAARGAVRGAVRGAPTAYSTAFETTLGAVDFGRSRAVHFNRANAALDSALRADAGFASSMEELIPGVQRSVSKVGGRSTPTGWVWHHASSSTAFGQKGVLRLVPGSQHTSKSPWWRVLHPDAGAAGGYSEWAIPAGAP